MYEELAELEKISSKLYAEEDAMRERKADKKIATGMASMTNH